VAALASAALEPVLALALVSAALEPVSVPPFY